MANKKAQLQQLSGFALTLVVFAVLVAVGLAVLGKVANTDRTTNSAFDINTTFVALNSSTVSFAEFNQFSCTGVNIYNSSNLANITGSFTISGCTARLNLLAINNTRPTVNYTYQYYSYGAGYNSTQTSVTAIQDMPGWVPVLIVAFIGGIVLFVVLRQFGTTGR